MYTRDVWQSIKQLTAPVAEPHDLAQARRHLRIDGDQADDNAEIGAMYAAARACVEKHLGRSLYRQRHRLTLSAFPCYIELPLPPLVEVVSIAYTDSAGDPVTLDPIAYTVSTDEGTIAPALGTSWPSTAAVRGAVTVEWWAGYTDGIVPEVVTAEAIGVSGSTTYTGTLEHAPDFDTGSVTFTDGTQSIEFAAAGSGADGDGTGTLDAAGAYSVTFDSATGAAVTAAYPYLLAPAGGDPLGAIPAAIKHAILLTLGDLYENRESIVVGTITAQLPSVANLLGPFRVVTV